MSCCTYVVIRLTAVQRADLDAQASRLGVKSEEYAASIIVAALKEGK